MLFNLPKAWRYPFMRKLTEKAWVNVLVEIHFLNSAALIVIFFVLSIRDCLKKFQEFVCAAVPFDEIIMREIKELIVPASLEPLA